MVQHMNAKPPAPRAPDQEKPKRVRVVERVEPFSKWQKLVARRMEELGLTTRALAEKVATASWKPNHSTLWAWIRAKEGYPYHKTYTSLANARLAKALEIDPDVLAEAYEDSRRSFTVSTRTSKHGPLVVLRSLFSESRRKTWTKQEIIELIDNLQG